MSGPRLVVALMSPRPRGTSNMTRTYDDPERYNGWANRETWAVALHINNDQGWQESVHEALRAERTERAERLGQPFGMTASAAGEIIRENVEASLHEWYMVAVADAGFDGDNRDRFEATRDDIGSLWRVDWTELGAAFLSDLAEQGSSVALPPEAPFTDPTTGEWVASYATRDAEGETHRRTEWFATEAEARRFARTGRAGDA